MNLKSRELPIETLVVGVPLPHDIIDPEGRVLLRQGHLLSETIVERWKQQGFSTVLIAPDERQAESAPVPRLLRDYDVSLVAEVSQVLDQARSALSEMIFEIALQAEPKLGVLSSISEALSSAISTDSDVVAAQAIRQFGQVCSARNAALLNRSVTLATVGTTAAMQLGMTGNDLLTIALAGVLHDVSLYEETLAMFLGDRPTDYDLREAMLRHPQRSADLLSSCRDVSELVRVVITQVHEQVDGSGFPRGVAGHLISLHAKLLNLVDAYLTLTDPNRRQAYVPADALAYLVGQTSQGAFDLDCMRALLKTLSVYSVGSRVVLSDNSEATVLRSSRSDPLRPIVRTDAPHSAIVDLRNTENFVLAPHVDPSLPNRRRLLRTELSSILWHPSIVI